MKTLSTIDVLIAGAGPVGLTAAAELARFGMRMRILDKNERRTDKSKAIVVWPRTLELIDRMAPQCAQRFIAAGLRIQTARIEAGREEIGHIDLTQVDSPYNFGLMIAQSETERLLEEHLQSLGVRVERQTELRSFEAQSDSVPCRLTGIGGEEAVQASWLIGCDGAHSTVRHGLGMEFRGKTLPTHWVLADVHLKGVDGPPAIRIYWHADGMLGLFPLSATRYRAIADVGEIQNEDELPPPTLEEIQEIVGKRAPGVEASDPVWLSSFSINERKVAEYRAGRIFLAGDAAHVHSPAGGQGMNTGMQDAFNLSWKLALAARGLGAAELLLSSYSAERSPVANALLNVTGRATAMALLRSGIQQSIRNHIASWLFGFTSFRHTMGNALTELSVGYPESPLNLDSKDATDPPAGRRCPVRGGEAPVGAGDTPRFALFADSAGLPADVVEKYGRILEPSARAAFHSGGLWLVRPDGYVAVATKVNDWDGVRGYLSRIAAP